MVLQVILFILLMTPNLYIYASGFDAYTSCYRTSRKGPDLPCDFGSQSWCAIPGSAYPWHAVRRFVHENQGLMRRMYGDERHISVLRAELENNDIEYFNDAPWREEVRQRYSKDMDGSKDFVKMFINNPKTIDKEKSKKSIEENSNNILFQSSLKSNEGSTFKKATLNSYAFNVKPYAKATTASPTTVKPTTETETSTVDSVESFNTTIAHSVHSTTTVPTTLNATTVDVPVESTTMLRTDTIEPQYNVSKTTAAPNLTQIEDEIDYVSETEESLTTTGTEGLTTTDEIDFEEEDMQSEADDSYDDTVEEAEFEDQEVAEEPVSQQAPPMIRLKGINACPVKEEVVAPFWANNTRGEVLALLNLYPFEQYVHWEKCTYEHKQMFCRDGCRCEQQYRLHRLLAYDPNNECRGIFSDWFRFPSCCVCKCYDLPMEFRLTSRSPRFKTSNIYQNAQFDRFTQLNKP